MSNLLPTVMTVQDLSGVGRASMTAAIEILSVMGCYACPLPTAVLSSITGVYSGYVMEDLTGFMERSLEHWAHIDMTFDYIYSGFLGSHRQVDVILSAKERFGSYLIADPVFADNGRLYDTMSAEMVRDMRRLVAQADLITPNVTEAQFLLNDFAPVASEQQAYALLERLSAMGPARVIITGCPVADTVYTFAYDKNAGTMHKIDCEYLPAFFHGAGDMFTSVVTGALARGTAFEPAVRQAVAFIRRAIDITVCNKLDVRRGLAIELVLKELAEGE